MGLLTEIADILGRNWGDNWDVHHKVAKEILSKITEAVDGEIPDILLKVYNNGFIYGELGMGLNDQESTAGALQDIEDLFEGNND